MRKVSCATELPNIVEDSDSPPAPTSVNDNVKQFALETLRADPEERTAEQLSALASWAELNVKLSVTVEMQKLAMAMTLIELRVGSEVFLEGHRGDAYYIVFSGAVNLHQKAVAKEATDDSQQKQEGTTEEGNLQKDDCSRAGASAVGVGGPSPPRKVMSASEPSAHDPQSGLVEAETLPTAAGSLPAPQDANGTASTAPGSKFRRAKDGVTHANRLAGRVAPMTDMGSVATAAMLGLKVKRRSLCGIDQFLDPNMMQAPKPGEEMGDTASSSRTARRRSVFENQQMQKLDEVSPSTSLTEWHPMQMQWRPMLLQC
jgi:hypothetical protein